MAQGTLHPLSQPSQGLQQAGPVDAGAPSALWCQVVTSSQASVEEDFGRGPWLAMKSSLGLDERDPTCFLCTYSIIMVLRKVRSWCWDLKEDHRCPFPQPLPCSASGKGLSVCSL